MLQSLFAGRLKMSLEQKMRLEVFAGVALLV
jgi:hypothetical protein